jgi:hypothetical protein
LVERLLCKQEVIGSIPFTSTKRGWCGISRGTRAWSGGLDDLRCRRFGCLSLWICVNRGFLFWEPWVLSRR